MQGLADIENVPPEKVFAANPGFPWMMLFKLLVGVLFFVNVCTLAIFSVQTPELFPEPNRDLVADMTPFPESNVGASFPPNIIESELIPAFCDSMTYRLVYDYSVKACNDDGFWEDFTKFDSGTLYVIGSVGSVLVTLVFVFVYYRFPRLLVWLVIFALILFITFMAIVGRNNSPSRGADSLSVLHRFIAADVTFLEYRAMLGLGTYIGATLSKKTYAIEPNPIYFDKLTRLVMDNDLTAGVELSNHCISNHATKEFHIDSEEVDRNKVSNVKSAANVTCVTLPAFIAHNKLQPPLFITFDTEDDDALSMIASWKPWLEKMDTEFVTRPVFFASVYTSEDVTTELKQDVCNVLNSFDLLFLEHYAYKITEPLTPASLCSNCRYLMMNKDMAAFYQLNTQAHDHIPEGNDTNSKDHGSNGGHGGHS